MTRVEGDQSRPSGRAALRVVVVAAAIAVFALAAAAATRDIAMSADVSFVAWVSRGPDGLEPIADWVMALGTMTGALFVWAPASLVRFRDGRAVLMIVIAAVAARWFAIVAKDWFESPRPSGHAGLDVREAVDGYGFPSGHASVAFALATAWAWSSSRRVERLAVFGIAAMVGALRWYVGVHYVVDVLGGAALGVAVGTGASLLNRRAASSR